jgi:tetratricopeptide (TPR) repeat protein
MVVLLWAAIAAAQGTRERAQSVSGLVREAVTNKVLEQARVRVEQYGVLRGEAFTDGNGNFHIFPLGAGEYDVTVSLNGYKAKRVRASVTAQSSANVVISLEPEGTATGSSEASVSVTELSLSDAARREYDIGMKALRENKCAQGVAAFKKVVELEPKYAGGFYGLGMGHYFCKDSTKAEAALRQALALDANLVPAYVLLGRILNNADKFAEAESVLRKAVAKPPDRSDALFEFGRALAGAGKMAEAEQALQKAHGLEGVSMQVHLLLANAFLMKGDLRAGLVEMEHYLEKESKGPLADEVRQKAEMIRAELAKQGGAKKP